MANDELQLGDQPGDKYDDIFGPGGERGGWYGGGSGPGGYGPPPGPGTQVGNPFLPMFSGGQSGGLGGFGGFGDSPWAGSGGIQRRRLMGGQSQGPFGAMQGRMEGSGGQAMGGGQAMTTGPSLPTGWWRGGNLPAPQQGSQLPWAQGGPGPKSSNEWLSQILAQAGFGGAFGLNPPSAIMAGVRGQAIQDAGARQRQARLGLMSRQDVDPSTFGFQSLMSDLQGQDQTARAMSGADLALRQQQLAFLQQLLGQYHAGNVGLEQSNIGRQAQQGQGGGLGGFLGGLGGLIPGVGGMFRGGRGQGGGWGEDYL